MYKGQGDVAPLGYVVKRMLPERIYAPGTTPAYSNYATALAGYVVERVSGLSFDDYIERKLEVVTAYPSQVERRAYMNPDMLRATARYWSRYSQATYVEPLEVIRESDSARSSSVNRESVNHL